MLVIYGRRDYKKSYNLIQSECITRWQTMGIKRKVVENGKGMRILMSGYPQLYKKNLKYMRNLRLI